MDVQYKLAVTPLVPGLQLGMPSKCVSWLINYNFNMRWCVPAYLCGRAGARQLGELLSCLLGSSSSSCTATVALTCPRMLLLLVVRLRELRRELQLLLCQLLRWAAWRHLQRIAWQPLSCSMVLLLPIALLRLPSGVELLLPKAGQPLPPGLRLPLPMVWLHLPRQGLLLLLAVALHPAACRVWRLLLLLGMGQAQVPSVPQVQRMQSCAPAVQVAHGAQALPGILGCLLAERLYDALAQLYAVLLLLFWQACPDCLVVVPLHQ